MEYIFFHYFQLFHRKSHLWVTILVSFLFQYHSVSVEVKHFIQLIFCFLFELVEDFEDSLVKPGITLLKCKKII